MHPVACDLCLCAPSARIFNDPQGVELCERTGRNPSYTYLSLGCSKAAEARMLSFARQQVGKPFSNLGMARSLIIPRKTDGSSWCACPPPLRPSAPRWVLGVSGTDLGQWPHSGRFCAELVCAALKVGGLIALDSNPGCATPHSLYKLYSRQAAATANPFTLRNANQTLSFRSMVGPSVRASQHEGSGGALSLDVPRGAPVASAEGRHRSDSPPRASFRLLSAREAPTVGLGLSLMSLRPSDLRAAKQ